VVFEELGFAAVQRLPAPAAAANLYHHEHAPDGASADGLGHVACLVVDLGFSATHAAPFLRGRAVQGAVRRLNVGGRLLTGFLQEGLSYRQYNMMDEVVIVNAAKEALCFVAPSGIDAEISRVGPTVKAASSVYAEWVLPTFGGTASSDDPDNSPTGYRRSLKVDPDSGRFRRTNKHDQSAAQCLRLEAERFLVPELLFRPSDVGLRQGGTKGLGSTWRVE